MATLQHPPQHIVGVDIAKDSAVIAIIGDGATGTTSIVANKRRAIRAALKRLKPDLVVCEPTGGYERLLIEECLKAGIACHRVVVHKVKGFITSFGVNGKSDAIDATMLARYGADRWATLPLWRERSREDEELRALVRRRQDLVAQRVAEKNRAAAPLAGAAGRTLAASFKAMLRLLDRQIAVLDTAIAAITAQNRQLRHRIEICTAMNGIGIVTAAALIALAPELGSMTRRQAAALTGLAPHPNESGSRKGYRRTRGGRRDIRPVLFMPALRTTQAKGEFAAFYRRLVDSGKKPMVAMTAVMRKIVVTLNARLRDNQIPQS